jgi:hypothetical protein
MPISQKSQLTQKLLILLLLYVDGPSRPAEPIPGKTRLMKTVFLFEEEVRPHLWSELPFLFPFEAYDFGPYSDGVFDAAAALEALGMISTSPVSAAQEMEASAEMPDDRLGEIEEGPDSGGASEDVVYSITDKGRAFIEQRVRPSYGITEAQWDALRRLKRRVLTASLRQLLRYVYSRYPDLTEKSKIKGSLFAR